MAYLKYNYLGATTQSAANLLSDVASMLSGQTTDTNLTGKVMLSSAAVGITNTSTTVTWVGADDGTVVAGRKNIAVGQLVFGTGIPDGTTVATITNQTGFTLSAAATETNAAAILTLDETSALPTCTIGSTTSAISTSNTSTNLTITGHGTATLGICAVGMSVEGFGIPSGTTIASITSANVVVMSAAATATVSPASIVLSPAAGVICDTANTTITSTVAAGWKLWDQYANSGIANKWVMRAPVADDSTYYKYVQFDISTAGFLQIHLFETWNNSTHAGTNQATAFATTAQQRVTLTVSASIAIAASARFIAMQSIVAAGIGDSDANSWTGIFERTRLAPWDTVANGYPPSLLARGMNFGYPNASSHSGGSCPRYKNPAGGDFTTTNATVYPCTMGWSGQPQPSAFTGNVPIGISTGATQAYSGTIKTKVPDGAGGFYTPFNELQFRDAALTKSFEGGSISTACDVWNTVSYPNNLDEVVKGTTTYIVWQNTLYATATAYANTYANASANTLFPKA